MLWRVAPEGCWDKTKAIGATKFFRHKPKDQAEGRVVKTKGPALVNDTTGRVGAPQNPSGYLSRGHILLRVRPRCSFQNFMDNGRMNGEGPGNLISLPLGGNEMGKDPPGPQLEWDGVERKRTSHFCKVTQTPPKTGSGGKSPTTTWQAI